MGICVSKKTKNLKLKPLDTRHRTLQNSTIKNNYTERIYKYYDFIRIIGSGKFGTVREAVRISKPERSVQEKRDNLPKFAVKSVHKASANHMGLELKRELLVLKDIDHPNLLNLLETYEDEGYMHFVTELCEGGSLAKKVSDKGHLNEDEARIVMGQLLLAVKYLHNNQYVHRDLKPENILFKSTEDLKSLKIVDFGLSKKIEKRNSLNSKVGTPHYMAPEVIAKKYGEKCDIWSLGITAFVILTGNHPFKGNFTKHIFNQVTNANIDTEALTGLSSQAKDFISKMLVKKPSRRLSAEEALKHPWLCVSNIPSQPLTLNFQTQSGFVQTCKRVMMKISNSSKLEELRKACLDIDTECCGYINTKCLKKYLEKNYTPEEAANTLRYFKGKLQMKYSYFLLQTSGFEVFDMEDYKVVFKYFDFDNDGYISTEDIVSSLYKTDVLLCLEEKAQLEKDLEGLQDFSMNLEEFKEYLLSK